MDDACHQRFAADPLSGILAGRGCKVYPGARNIRGQNGPIQARPPPPRENAHARIHAREHHRRRDRADVDHARSAHEGGHGGGRASPARLRPRGEPDAGRVDQRHRVHDQGRPDVHAGAAGVHPAVRHRRPLRPRQHHARQDQDGGGDRRQPARPLLPREHARASSSGAQIARIDKGGQEVVLFGRITNAQGRAAARCPGHRLADRGGRSLRHPERHRGDRLPRHLPHR